MAITADYLGLVPTSQVTETEIPALKKGSVLVLFLLPYNSRVLQGRSSGQKAEPVATRQQGAARPGRLKRSAVRIEALTQRYGTPSLLQDIIYRGILTPMPSFQEKERSPDYSRRGYQSRLHKPSSKAGLRGGNEYKACAGCSSNRGYR